MHFFLCSPTFSKAATVAFFINVADVGLYAALTVPPKYTKQSSCYNN